MKYKIIEHEDLLGNKWYTIKKKFLWFWIPYGIDNDYTSTYRFNTLDDAKSLIFDGKSFKQKIIAET